MRKPVASNVAITQGFKPTHLGIDYSAKGDKTVYAPEAGQISTEEQPYKGGHVIVLRGKTGRHHLAHLSKYLVKTGNVKEGQPVGIMGSSGKVTGPHLHWSLYIGGKRVNPLKYVSNETITVEEMFSVKQIKYLAEIGNVQDSKASIEARAKKPGFDTAVDYMRDQRGRLVAEIKAKDKIMQAQQKAIDKLVAENSKTGKEAIKADLEKKVQVEPRNLLAEFFSRLFGGR